MLMKPKGTQDVLPQENYKWHFVEDTVKEIAKRYHLEEIRTPTFEAEQLFLRSVGEETDIVSKEMYLFTDKGNRKLALKPEGTAGVIRAFLENGLYNTVLPQKLYYLSPIFRYERPQAGRLREHHQFGVEIFGSAMPEADAELIAIANQYLHLLGIDDAVLQLNSIGCPNCRPHYLNVLNEYFLPHKDNLCSTCNIRFDKNILRILDCKEEQCQSIIQNVPKSIEFLCEECQMHFQQLQLLLKSSHIPFVINARLVRGLDYYTKTVFEFVSSSIGAQGTLLGGGRYDNLIANLGGKPLPAVGFGSGIERILLQLDKINGIEKPKNNLIYIASLSQKSKIFAFQLAEQLRQKGMQIEIDLLEKSIKAQFKYANAIHAKFVIAVGEEELNSGVVKIKNMDTGYENIVDVVNITNFFKQ